MKKIPYFDIQQHLKDWHRFVLPIFVIVAALLMILFLVARTNEQSPFADWTEDDVALVGLISPVAAGIFDPAFAVASPSELVAAPTALFFDFPMGSQHGGLTYNAQPFLENRHLGDDLNGIGGQNSDLGDPIFASSDGLVIYAGWPSDGWGNVVILLHEREGGRLLQTLYAHLDTVFVPVGKQVRRGDKLGTNGNANGRYLAHLHYEIRGYPTIDVGVGYADSELGRLDGELVLKRWRNRAPDELRAAPKGEPIEPGALQLEVEEPNPSES
ncbi:MAG: M23 family metallopeptidase [Verrucomicrobiota bacterium]